MAPAALLAQDLQTGKLGSICSASGGAPSVAADDQDATPYHAHCPICSVAWGLPVPSTAWAPTQAPQALALAAVAEDPAAPVVGLPFSRGPPAL